MKRLGRLSALILLFVAILAAARPASWGQDPVPSIDSPLTDETQPKAKPEAKPEAKPPAARPALPAAGAPAAQTEKKPIRSDQAKKPVRSSVLAIPGLTIPPRATRINNLPSLEPIQSADPDDPPALEGPVELRKRDLALPRSRTSANSTGIPLEPLPMDATDPLSSSRRDPAKPRSRQPGRSGDDEVDSRSPRRRGFFDRRANPSQSGETKHDGVIAVEPRNDPATDAELKRRIERQIRQVGGDRIRSLEVKVVGKRVTIKAKATHFWQRRSLKHSIETLPTLVGNRTQIDVTN